MLDFKGLASVLLSDAPRFLVHWCPGGRIVGREYTAAGIRGGQGDSFKCNVETGVFQDFATGEKGGDLIELYALNQNIKPGEAAKELSKIVNYPLAPTNHASKSPPSHIGRPPEHAIAPTMEHLRWGAPTASWCYRQASRLPLFYEARYDAPEGKQYIPWSWDKSTGRWVAKGYPAPRPLWGLDVLCRQPAAPVLIVEGPKCAEAASALAGHVYVVATWSNGASGYAKTDWSPLYGREVIIWPDADTVGVDAGAGIAKILGPHCKIVKMINVEGMPDHWDVADALAEGWDWDRVKEWAIPRVSVVVTPEPIAEAKPDDESPAQSKVAIYEEYGLALTKSGNPHFNIDNSLRLLERCPDFQDFIWYDEFHQRYFTTWNGPRREWSDADTVKLTHLMQGTFGLYNVSDKTVFQAVMVYAHRRTKNEPRDWMESLTWDGVSRAPAFFWDCFGVEESEYSHALGTNFWIGMIARILSPGCQLDNMVILEGLQGSGKTSALRIIGGSWYTSAHYSVQNTDFFQSIQGKLIIEISELEAFSKAEATRIKNVITASSDRYRASYGRTAQDHPRQCIFVGSTNEKSYLKDHTGARRFWPVRCHKIDIERIRENRDQYFAEAVHRFKVGEKWYEMPADSTGMEQHKRRQQDVWEQAIIDWLPGRFGEVSVMEVAKDCLKIEISKLDIPTQVRIAKALSTTGWEQAVPGNTWREKSPLPTP